MKVRALKSFNGRYGKIRAGNVFECEPSYFRALARNGLAKIEPERAIDGQPQPEQPGEKKPPGPSEDRDLKKPPNTAGKDAPGDQRKPPGATGRRTGGGPGVTSRSLRADLHSRGKTAKKSGDGDEEAAATLAAANHAMGGDPGPSSGGSEGASGGE